jgi:hypothetical protein
METKKQSKLWELLVPRYSNEGIEYLVEHHKEWDEKVRQLSGGITILKTAKGNWLSPEGRLFVEEMIPVRICCDEENIEKIIDQTLRHYNQKAVFAYELSSNVKVKHNHHQKTPKENVNPQEKANSKEYNNCYPLSEDRDVRQEFDYFTIDLRN